MTICGYNALIGKGLSVLVEGMIQAMIEREHNTGMPMSELLDIELIEIESVSATLARIDMYEYHMFMGLNVLALPFFREVRRRLIGQVDFSDVCREVCAEFVMMLESVEVRFQEMQKVKGRSVALEQLLEELPLSQR